MIFDHVGITVANFEQAKQFYVRVLAALGIEVLTERRGWLGFGRGAQAEFWLGPGKSSQYFSHLSFRAASRDEVDLFYQTALAAGAVCNGPPKWRQDYYPNYYAAFVIDPDGHYLGALLHQV